MARENFALRRDDPDALILVLLSLDRAKQLTARIFRLPDLVQVHGNRHEVSRDLLNDGLIR
jgi:hypothetical protein